MNKKNFIEKKYVLIVSLLAAIILAYLFFDKGLFIGLILLLILSVGTLFVLNKSGLKEKNIYILFFIVLGIHLGTTLFMHYADFQPFSGHNGDYTTYQKSAVEISQGFRQGDFSIKNIALKYPDLYTEHYYPVVVGAIYALTLPREIIGLIFNVWLVAVSIIFVYLIILDIGGLEKNAFIIGLIVAIYPSYIFNTGLLLKDALEIFLTILGLLFSLKVVKKFDWRNFLVLYLALIGVTHFRFYIGYALILTFLLSWFLFSRMDLKKRVIYGMVFIVILGFIPQIAAGQGYYGINSVEIYLNSKMIHFYRQQMYNPVYYKNSTAPLSLNSSFSTGVGIKGYFKSFVYVLLGPFPWQIKYLRQSFALFETFPWYLLLFFVVDGIIICFKKRTKEAAPLFIFSIIVLVVIAIFDNNYGLIVRIRIPAFISLLCIGSFGLNENNIIYNYLNKFYEKIFSYGRGWFYRKSIS